jgi:NAD(P)-dependent dehydrogenase (short-subunit alcohol dehydrogenase family)
VSFVSRPERSPVSDCEGDFKTAPRSVISLDLLPCKKKSFHSSNSLFIFIRDVLYDQIVKANVVSVTKMCAMIMPGMVERKKGVVINISSLSALMPSSMYAVYAASKVIILKIYERIRMPIMLANNFIKFNSIFQFKLSIRCEQYANFPN